MQHDDKALRNVAERLARARRVSVLTGAGISAESGVPTFRGPDGLWKTFRAEDLATPEAFAKDPKLSWEWYDWRRQKLAPCLPNAGHEALVRLEQNVEEFTLVTQNVDGLHRRAGSRNVEELHGNIWRLRCTGCSHRGDDFRAPLPELPPRCACGSVLRPDVVWFGEILPPEPFDHSVQAMSRTEVLLVVGTSALVYPAASLPLVAKQAGGFVVEINKEETPLSPLVDVTLVGPASRLLPAIVGGSAGV
ncbi:MAG: SIR2 family NAD-dependent protein deacylase [Vicinamibacteria bacterium]